MIHKIKFILCLVLWIFDCENFRNKKKWTGVVLLNKVKCLIVTKKEGLFDVFKKDNFNFLSCNLLDVSVLISDLPKYTGDVVIIDGDVLNVADLLHVREQCFSDVRNVFYLSDVNNIQSLDIAVFEKNFIDK